jgi:hypothetical protein
MWVPESLKPNRSRFCVVFLGPGANSELVANTHVALRACYAALHKFNFRIFAKTQPSLSYQNFVIMLALQTQNAAQMLSYFPRLHTPNRALCFTLSPSLPEALPCFKPTFAIRTRGRCVRTFRAVIFPCFPR